jgi:hypothetical protein
MSKHKSELIQRHPIASTGELLVDAAKYKLTDDTLWRLVTEFEIRDEGRTLEMVLDCGHHRLVRSRKKRWHREDVPGTLQCGVCREDLAFLAAEQQRKMAERRRKR